MARARNPLSPPDRPAPTRADSKEIVEAILTAATEVVDPDVSVDVIAERAGVGVASLYRYFPSRGAIYAEISRRLQARFLEQLRDLLATDADFDTQLEALARIVVDSDGVSKRLRRCLNVLVPLSWSEDIARKVFLEAVEMISAHLRRTMDPPPPDVERRVFAAFSAVRGLVMMAMVFPEQVTDDEVLVRQVAAAARFFVHSDVDAAPAGDRPRPAPL